MGLFDGVGVGRKKGRKIMAYTLDEVEYPSVTAIIGQLDKPALKGWAAGCAVDYISERLDQLQHPKGPHTADNILAEARRAYTLKSDKAKNMGTIVHDALEWYIKDGRDALGKYSPEVENALLAFFDWEKKNHVEWEASEVTLFHRSKGYAGTCDAIATINGIRYLIDLKTSRAIYDEYRLQLAAYRQAYNINNTKPIDNVGVLRLDKETGEPEMRDLSTNIDQHAQAFDVLTMLYYSLRRRKLRNNRWAKVWYPEKRKINA